MSIESDCLILLTKLNKRFLINFTFIFLNYHKFYCTYVFYSCNIKKKLWVKISAIIVLIYKCDKLCTQIIVYLRLIKSTITPIIYHYNKKSGYLL